jgi:sugar phosphate isomerase/epimerase
MNVGHKMPPIKVAMQTHCVRSYLRGRNPTTEEMHALLAWAAQAGFDGIDISDSWDFAALTRSDATATRESANAHGLQIPAINCIAKNLADRANAARYITEIERGLEVASWCGSPVLNISLSVPREAGAAPVVGAATSRGGSRGASEQDFEITADALRRVARAARARGIELSLELHDRSLADTSATLLKILDLAGEPNVKANPDLCNGYRAYERPSETWQEALVALAPRSNLWHVNNLQRIHFEAIQRAAFVECDLGAGDIDYAWALSCMRASAFGGWIVIEYKGTGSAFETLARGRDYLARIAADPAIAALQAGVHCAPPVACAKSIGQNDG